MKNTQSHSLWRWFCLRIFSLAVGSILLIAMCMWLRYALLNWWVLQKMPLTTRQEFLYLREHPNVNTTRFNQLVDLWFGQSYSDPSITSTDWELLGILVIVVIPIMVTLGLRAARPLSTQFSHLAKAAKAVSDGNFSVIATQEKQAPQELLELTHDFNAMTKQLARYDKELRASHVALAHELRSPLTAAIGRVQGVLDGVFPYDHKQLDMVMHQLQHLNRLIGDLHFLSLVDAKQLLLTKTAIHLDVLLQEKILWLQPQLDQLQFCIENHLPQKLCVKVDSLRLGQLITILFENALRYANDGKKMTVHANETTSQWELHFRDYGKGISDDFLPKMFQKFTRADDSRARHSGGSGLGLSIAEAIAKAHAGTLTAENHPHGGLNFILILPKINEPE